jgi:CRISPR/Cas system-associated endonuclease Cas1
MDFSVRETHPTNGAVNALLNLACALALYKIGSILFAQGFDTAPRFLHTIFRDRLSLSLDVLEPFRGTLERLR